MFRILFVIHLLFIWQISEKLWLRYYLLSSWLRNVLDCLSTTQYSPQIINNVRFEYYQTTMTSFGLFMCFKVHCSHLGIFKWEHFAGRWSCTVVFRNYRRKVLLGPVIPNRLFVPAHSVILSSYPKFEILSGNTKFLFKLLQFLINLLLVIFSSEFEV